MVKSTVHGVSLDSQTRCAHYSTLRDVIAIQMKCCGIYYACKECHDAMADHAIEVWPRSEWDSQAVLCGICGTEMSIRQYLDCENECPACCAPFNPGCRNHYHYYFEWNPVAT
ncbi:CHY zinc finger protein [Acidicapsa ligni]|uniref:CHY zinc finger protein n=1 Tax=Acidicapsa ligni TaxID=542300 RepID=UPI0021E0B6A6|nr:CHY zinc finger protein [Acidicapsa ligni]